MRVLQTLVEADGGVVSRDELLESAWPDVVVGEEVLTHAVAELRRALGDRARAPTYIETVHRSGYRLLPSDDRAGATTRMDGASNRQAILWSLQARALFVQGGRRNLDEALDLLGRAISLRPDDPSILAERSKATLFCALYYDGPTSLIESGAEMAERAVRFNPSSPAARAALGLAYASADDREKAFDQFGSAIRLGEESFLAHYLFGRACFAAGDWAMAAALLEQASRLHAEDFHALYLAAKARRALNETLVADRINKAALGRLERHLEINSDSLRGQVCRAGLLADLGRVDEAMQVADDVAELNDPMTYYLVGAYARAGRIGTALDRLEHVIDSGWSHLQWLGADPDLDLLRDHPRFRRCETAVALH